MSKRFAKTYKTEEFGQLLIQAVKEGEMAPDEPAHVRFTFDPEIEGHEGRAILCSEMSFEDALKVIKNMTKGRAITTAMDMIEDVREEASCKAFVRSLVDRLKTKAE